MVHLGGDLGKQKGGAREGHRANRDASVNGWPLWPAGPSLDEDF